MVQFFCSGCWHDFPEDVSPCPHCGLDIRAAWDSKDYVEKLIVALQHPEPSTPIRAAWLLGELGNPRAVQPLIDLFNRTEDPYILRAAAKALGRFDNDKAREFVAAFANHPSRMIRDMMTPKSRSGTENVPETVNSDSPDDTCCGV